MINKIVKKYMKPSLFLSNYTLHTNLSENKETRKKTSEKKITKKEYIGLYLANVHKNSHMLAASPLKRCVLQ